LKECNKLAGNDIPEVIVLLNSDSSIKKLKGSERPYNSVEERKNNLIATELVHKVIVFNTESELLDLIKNEQPDFLVKGEDYKKSSIVGAKEVEENGGNIHLVQLEPSYSTTNISLLQKHTNIIVTGGLGFIGSNFIKFLNQNKITNIYIVDDLKNANEKWQNIVDLEFIDLIDYRKFEESLKTSPVAVADYIINLGACSSTSEENLEYLWEANTNFARNIIRHVAMFPNIVLLHASSAATYGLSNDFTERINNLKPLNKYGFSKLVTDKFINDLLNTRSLHIYSFRFFNVYGPRETYKGNMKSIITKFIEEDLKLKKEFPDSLLGNTSFEDTRPFKCYRSYKKEVADGEMKRDFIYVEDVCKILFHFMLNPKNIKTGIYNVGTGKATSVNEILAEINKYRKISYVEMPEILRPIYQYFTEANVEKLRTVGNYNFEFTSLAEGIKKTKDFYNKI